MVMVVVAVVMEVVVMEAVVMEGAVITTPKRCHSRVPRAEDFL